jgi:uncharacterized membrane protein YhaH (DUF805 family)
MKYLLAIFMIPFCFLTEYFIVAQWLHFIQVSWWWILYFMLADTGNGIYIRRIIGVSLLPEKKRENND